MNNLSDKGLDNVVNKTVDKSDSLDVGHEVNREMNLESLSLFNADPYFNFVYKKSERLCMAIYLITDFFPAEDSIKDNMRKVGTELLKVSLSLITASSPQRRNILNDISRLCLEVVSLSKIASSLGMTSVPNHNVLEGEIKNFISVIELRERPSTTGQGFVLNEEVLGQDIIAPEMEEKSLIKSVTQNVNTVSEAQALVAVPVTNMGSNTVSKNLEVCSPKVAAPKSYYHVEEKSEVRVNSLYKKEGSEVSLNETVDTTVANVAKSVLQKNERQQVILGVIRETGETSIKDISDSIKDCSEKTIQRELNTLIYDGVLKKIGERRWSKYVLA